MHDTVQTECGQREVRHALSARNTATLFCAMARTLTSGQPAMGVPESGLMQVKTQ